MSKFQVDGVTLDIPDDQLTDPLRKALQGGFYELAERQAMNVHLREGDRMVDLGAGAGYLCCVGAEKMGSANVLGVEGNPEMVPVARANLRANGHGKGRIWKGAVVPDTVRDTEVSFMISHGFWASGLKGEQRSWGVREVTVPAFRISDIMEAHAPTLVVMDIEGAEASFTDYIWPNSVRLVILEVHPSLYPPQKLNAIFTGYFDQGFTWTGRGSRNDTLVFERITD